MYNESNQRFYTGFPKNISNNNRTTRREAEKHYDEMLEYYQTGEVDTIGTLDQLMRLRQICTCPELLNLDCENAKQEALIQYIEENKGKPILVFSCFSSYLMKLHAHLYKDYRIHTITGKVSVENRQKYVDMFQRGILIFYFVTFKRWRWSYIR